MTVHSCTSVEGYVEFVSTLIDISFKIAAGKTCSLPSFDEQMIPHPLLRAKELRKLEGADSSTATKAESLPASSAGAYHRNMAKHLAKSDGRCCVSRTE